MKLKGLFNSALFLEQWSKVENILSHYTDRMLPAQAVDDDSNAQVVVREAGDH